MSVKWNGFTGAIITLVPVVVMAWEKPGIGFFWCLFVMFTAKRSKSDR